MKGTSLIYSILRKELGSKYRVELLYDVRAVERSPEGVVLVWQSGLSRQWYGIGGKYMNAVEDVSVFYSSTSRSKYEEFDRELRRILESKKWNYRFVDEGVPTDVVATDSFVEVWPYAYKFSSSVDLSEGQYVSVTDVNNNTKTGWIIYKDSDGKYVMYVGRGIFYLVNLRSMREESLAGRFIYTGTYSLQVMYVDSEVM